MECFTIYQLMYLIIDELNDENPQEKVILFLSDANPFMRQGDHSVDEVVYKDFKEKFYKFYDESKYSYYFICDFLKKLDSYYGDIYSLFRQLKLEEFNDTCDNIIRNFSSDLKFL